MSNAMSGFQAPATNEENPRVVAQESKVESTENAVLSPDRPPRAPEGNP